MYAHVHACKHGCEARVCEASAPGCTTNEKSRPGANLAIEHEADLTTLIMLLVGQSRHSAQFSARAHLADLAHMAHKERTTAGMKTAMVTMDPDKIGPYFK